jgi:UDPglucose--hexose-1-phosphate uridylyltransferase
MGHLRKDFLLERYSIISETRGKRPQHFDTRATSKRGQVCFFCPGNEKLTPPTIDRYPEKGDWQIRVFRNKFPALSPPEGDHEIIVESGKHNKQLHDLKCEELYQAMLMYEKRRLALLKKFKHVSIFKNFGKEAGASLPHSHTQVLASDFQSSIEAQETQASKNYYNKWHRCPWCDYIEKIDGKRVACKSKHSVAITANAPRFPYEVWVMPRRHVATFSELSHEEKLDFCDSLKKILMRVSKDMGPYNFVVHWGKTGDRKFFHFHIEIMPRLSTHAGYELGSGVFIIDTSPETAAKFFRS